jgi:hypothetical protein
MSAIQKRTVKEELDSLKAMTNRKALWVADLEELYQD